MKNDSAEIFVIENAERHRALTLDTELYQHYLEESGLDVAKREVFLETLWSVICQFAELGYHIHPVQCATGNSCGELPALMGLTEIDPANALNSPNTSITEQLNAASMITVNKEES